MSIAARRPSWLLSVRSAAADSSERPSFDATRLSRRAAPLFRRAVLPGWNPRRLIVVKPCCLGDVLMATPTIAAIAACFPEARLDVAVGGWSRAGLQGNPHVADTVDPGPLLGGRRPDLAALLRFVARLRHGRYDGAVVLERSLWLCLAPTLAGIPVRVGLDSGGRGATHTVAVPVPHVGHEAELYLDCAGALGATRPRRMLFRPGATARAEAGGALHAAGWRGERYAVLHPGGGDNPGMRLLGKRWPPDRFAEIARRLDSAGIRPVLVWGPTDTTAAAEVRAADIPNLIPLEGLTLGALGAVAAGARVYIGNDSGPTHIATAVGTPTVAIFGPSDERRYGPWGTHDDGTPIGLAVANPLLAAGEPAPAWLTRPTTSVGVDDAWQTLATLGGITT